MKSDDQLFSNMLHAAHDWLKGRSPYEISLLGNIPFDSNAFHFQSFGKSVTVTYPAYEITPQLHQWHILSILHYLNTADGTSLTGQLITFAQYKDGLIRGGNFDRTAEKMLSEKISQLSEEEFKKRILALGGTIHSSNADLCAEFHFMPNYPIWMKIWFADDEFPASGRLFADPSAAHYLSIEDAVTIGELLLQLLFEECH